MSTKHRATWVASASASTFALAWVVACYTAPEGGAKGSSVAPSGCTPQIDSIQKTIFIPRCATEGCHVSPDPQSSLDLTMQGLDARLVGAPAVECGGQTLVVPGDPSKSYLVAKLTTTKPACGTPMPNTGQLLDPADVACITKWISGLTPGSFDGGGGFDAGGTACPDPSLTSCAGTCVDLKADKNNCGTCGTVCPVVCSEGACATQCTAPRENCNGACVDTSTSSTNCGSCGNACTGGKVCVNKTCTCGTTVATLVELQASIFTPKCATSKCHAPSTVGMRTTPPQADLDLRDGQSYKNLVNVSASQCGSRKRVVAGDVANSYVVNKLTGFDMCSGTKMPGGANPDLTTQEIDKIRSWICNGAAP